MQRDGPVFVACGLGAETREARQGHPNRRRGMGGQSTRNGAGDPAHLAGASPQIAKGEGDAGVQSYIAAMPGWKRAVGQRLDAIMADAVPGVRKAVGRTTPV